MSRLEEVEAEIDAVDWANSWEGEARSLRALARTLAAEVDDLRGKLNDVRQNIGCARGQRSTQYCAEAAQRDEVIGKLLAMLKPDPKVPCDCIGEIGPQCYCMNQGDAMRAESWWTEKCLYARACEIAGRES